MTRQTTRMFTAALMLFATTAVGAVSKSTTDGASTDTQKVEQSKAKRRAT